MMTVSGYFCWRRFISSRYLSVPIRNTEFLWTVFLIIFLNGQTPYSTFSRSWSVGITTLMPRFLAFITISSSESLPLLLKVEWKCMAQETCLYASTGRAEKEIRVVINTQMCFFILSV